MADVELDEYLDDVVENGDWGLDLNDEFFHLHTLYVLAIRQENDFET